MPEDKIRAFSYTSHRFFLLLEKQQQHLKGENHANMSNYLHSQFSNQCAPPFYCHLCYDKNGPQFLQPCFPHDAKQSFNLTAMVKNFLLHAKQRSEITPYPGFMLYRLPPLWMRFWTFEPGNWKQLNIMLALCAVGHRRRHSLAMQVSSVLGRVFFERYNASNRCMLLPSHSLLFFNPFILPSSQLHRFPSLGKSDIGMYIGCLCCLSLAIGAHLSMTVFCSSLLVQTGMQFAPYIWARNPSVSATAG